MGMRLNIILPFFLLLCFLGFSEIQGMQKSQPPLAANIGPYIRQALEKKDKETIDFYKQFRPADLAHYFDMEVTRYTYILFKKQLEGILKQALDVDYKLPLGKYVSYAIRNGNNPEIVTLLITNADQSDSQFINAEIERLYKQASQSHSESEKKQLTEQIATLFAYNLMIPKKSSEQKTAQPSSREQPFQEKAQSFEEVAQEIRKRQSQPQHRLIAAIQKQDLAALKQALKDGANTYDAFGTGLTPLEWATTIYNYEIMLELLKHGANPTDVLGFAIRTEKNNLLKALIASDADITMAGLLEDAIDAQNFEGAQILLQKGLPERNFRLARNYLLKHFRYAQNTPQYLKWQEIFGIKQPSASATSPEQEVPQKAAKPKTEEELFKEFIEKARTLRKPEDGRPDFDLITYFKLKVAPYASPHEILIAPANASKQEIKKAYIKRSLEWHPDRNKSSEATQVFQLIAWAYDKALEGLQKKK